MKKTKYIAIIIGIIIIALLSGLILYNVNQPNVPKNIDKFKIDNKEYKLKRFENLYVRKSENETTIMFVDEELDEIPELVNGITIGTNYKEVLKTFNIKENYAHINMEVSDELEDGTTDIIDKTYKNDKVFKREYLNLYLTFGYIKQNGKWKMIEDEELDELWEETDEEVLIYKIVFEGLSGEAVGIGEVTAFSINHH